jgi:hypothetical protein
VVFRGVRIGRVSSIEVEPDGQAVRVSVDVQQEVALPQDAAAVVAPESMFGDWQAEIVSRARYPRYHFYEVPKTEAGGDVRVLGGYTLPELSRLTASAEEISNNLASLTNRLELAFNEETVQNLSRAIDNMEAISAEIRDLVNQQAAVATKVTANADSALTEIEQASRAARRSFERVEALLADAQLDSIVTNVRLATGSIQQVSATMSGAHRHPHPGRLGVRPARPDHGAARRRERVPGTAPRRQHVRGAGRRRSPAAGSVAQGSAGKPATLRAPFHILGRGDRRAWRSGDGHGSSEAPAGWSSGVWATSPPRW